MREVDFAVGKRRRERRQALSALAGSGPSPFGRGGWGCGRLGENDTDAMGQEKQCNYVTVRY